MDAQGCFARETLSQLSRAVRGGRWKQYCRVNVVLSALMKGRRSRAWGGETIDKMFKLHVIKALKDNECERLRIKKKSVCVCVLDQRLHTEFECGLLLMKNCSLWAFIRKLVFEDSL